MAKKKKKKKKTALYIIIFGLFLTIFIQQQVIINRINRKNIELNKSLESAQKQNETLKEHLELTKRDDFLEVQAREKLRLIKPGETLFIDRNNNK